MSISTGLRLIVVLGCLFAAADSFAQSDFTRHNWYFGNTTRAIRFSRSDNTPSLINNKAIPFGQGGSAVATNPINGDLLFYTDGQNVYDVTYPVRTTIMLNGNLGALAGPPRNQPVAISPVPGSPTQYYIFRNTATFTTPGTVQVSRVDMSLSGNERAPEPPAGAVLDPKNVDIPTPLGPTLNGRSEAMITVPDNTGNNFWLITHENGGENFTVTRIDATGFLPASTTNYPITGIEISAANFSYHAATGKIAVSPQSANDNVIILNFDNVTGAISFDRFVLTSGVASTLDQAIYDTEWSPSGRFLYVSIHGETGITADVVQFDMNASASNSLVSVLDGAVTRSFGLKLAPDTAIYHLYQDGGGRFIVGRFTDVDSVAARVIHESNPFGGAINFMGRQFPEFLPQSNNPLTLSFTTSGNCENYPVSFFPNVQPAADSLQWTFGDGESSSDWSPVHTYESNSPPAGFNVQLTAFLNGRSQSIVQPITITNFNLEITLPADTTACRCEFPPPVGDACNNGPFSVRARPAGASGTVTYQWSNGDTGQTLTPDSAGYYYVLATDNTVGCVAYAGVNVREYDAEDQRANIWYFGLNAGIDFNEQPPIPIEIVTDADGSVTPPIRSPEGVSVISDRNGQVVFSTDGVFVYDREDRIIEASPGLPIQLGGENASAQSALIVPVPGDETLYYIFTTQQVHGSNTYRLMYALYDIKLNDGVTLNNGDGGIVRYDQLLFTRSTERITSDGRWLIAHEFGNNSFRSYEITADGIGNPVISSIGSDHRLTEIGEQGLMGQGYMKLGGGLLAVALPDPPDNYLEVFDFIDSTGMVTNFRRLDLESDEGQVYGVEFSGGKIFTTIRGTSESFLREAYIDFQDNPVLVPGSADSDPIEAELGAIQQGPDGTVYVAINGSNFLGTLNVVADTLQLSSIEEQGYSLAPGAQSQLGLPNFIQEIFDGTGGPFMSVTGLCVGTPSLFQVTPTNQEIDQFLWTFDGGFTSTEQSFSYTFGTPGSKIVTVRITNRCGLDTLLTQTVVIAPPPPDPTFVAPGQQPTVCNGPLTLQALPANDPSLTYLWSTGETTFTIDVDRTQNIGLTITNAQGCTSSDDIFISDNRPVLDLGPDQEVCQDAVVAPLNAQNPGGLRFEWRINGTISGTTREQAVSTTVPGTFEYWVLVADDGLGGNGCRVQDSVVFTVNPLPVYTASASPIACNATNGEIELDITAPASASFTYVVTGLNTGAVQTGSTGATTVIIPGLSMDTYLIDVADQVSGCEASTSVGVNSSNISIVPVTPVTACGTTTLTFDVNASGGTNWDYQVFNAATGAEVIPLQDIPSVPATITTSLQVPVPGEYTVVVIDNNGCRASENITVVSDQLIVAAIEYVVCPDLTLTAVIEPPVAGPVTYQWFGTNVTPINAPTITIEPQPGEGVYTYGVTLNAPGYCETTHTVEITIDDVEVDFIIPVESCVDNLTLTATVDPPGDYTYSWYRDGVEVLPSGQFYYATTADNGLNFQVEAISTLSGCSFFSEIKRVFVLGEIEVFIQAQSPCKGDQFSIEASVIPGATYEWFLGTLQFAETGPVLSGLTQEGRYRVVATRGDCSAEASQPITFVDDPDGGLPNRRYICNRPENLDCSKPEPENSSCVFQLEAAFGASWQWYRSTEKGGPRSPLIGQTNKTLTVSAPGFYWVDITGPTGCLTTDMTEVIERCEPDIKLPNVFRPDGDQEINQTFSVFPFQTFVASEGFEVYIYNRWGEMVYQSSDLNFKWNGTYKGNGSQLLPVGTYTYVIKYFGTLTNSGQKELRGAVLLLR